MAPTFDVGFVISICRGGLSPQVWQRHCGFDVVRVEVRLKPYSDHYNGGIRPHDEDRADEERVDCVRLIEERLGTALGEAKWEKKDSGTCFEEVLVAEFRPRVSRQ